VPHLTENSNLFAQCSVDEMVVQDAASLSRSNLKATRRPSTTASTRHALLPPTIQMDLEMEMEKAKRKEKEKDLQQFGYVILIDLSDYKVVNMRFLSDIDKTDDKEVAKLTDIIEDADISQKSPSS
jgi:hypothetical protein